MKKSIIITVKDDPTNLFLLYRKFAVLDFDYIGVETCYEKGTGAFVSSVINILPSFNYIGPTDVPSDYVDWGNFPSNIDLGQYSNTVLNLDMVKHIKNGLHIDKIYPMQKTCYNPSLNVNVVNFNKGRNMIEKDSLNICINPYDGVYNCAEWILDEFAEVINFLADKASNKKLEIFTLVIGRTKQKNEAAAYLKVISSKVPNKNVSFVKEPITDISIQLGILLNSDLFITIPLGLGILAYSTGVKTLSLIPMSLSWIYQATIDLNKRNYTFLELKDTDLNKFNLDKVWEIVNKPKAVQQKRG